MRVIESEHTEVLSMDQAIPRFVKGMDQAFDLVATTYGASGGNVMVVGTHARQVFDDGFKAVAALAPEDPIVREGVFYLRDAALAQRDKIGDGTSTATLLTYYLIREGLKLAGVDDAAIALVPSEGIFDRDTIIVQYNKLVDRCDEMLDAVKRTDVPESLVAKVATLAMHGNAEWGAEVGKVVHAAGKYGAVLFNRASGNALKGEVKKGVVFQGGVIDHALLRHENRFVSDETLILMVNESLDNIEATWMKKVILAWEQECRAAGKHLGLVLMCQSAAGSMLSTFIGQPTWCAVHVPAQGKNGEVSSWTLMNDVAEMFGGKVYDSLRGAMPEQMSAPEFARVPGFWATKNASGIMLSAEQESALDAFRKAISDQYSSDDDAKALDERDARLAPFSGAYGELRIPFLTESEFSSAKEVLEDGYFAAKAALDGVVPGGGNTLMWISKEIDLPVNEIVSSFKSALNAVARMAGNEEDSYDLWIARNLRTGAVGDAIDVGVIDPAIVLKTAIRTAVSVASQIINTKSLVIKHQKVKFVD